jgi:hypothetical protein
MRHLVIALLVLMSVACESNKESLPGSYKLEQTKAEIEEANKYYSLKNFSPTQDRTTFTFSVGNNKEWDKDLYKGTLSLKPSIKDQKNYITLNITFEDAEITHTVLFTKNPEKIQEIDLAYKDLIASCAFVCRDLECKTIALSPSFGRDGKKNYFRYTSVWQMSFPEGENNLNYKISDYYTIQGDQEVYLKMYNDPLYILKLPLDSPELKKWQLF